MIWREVLIVVDIEGLLPPQGAPKYPCAMIEGVNGVMKG